MTRVGTVLVSGAGISVDYGLPLTSGLLSALAHRYPADSAARRQADMSDAWLVWLLDELQRTTNLELDFEELLTSIHACMVAEREGAVFDRLPAARRSDDDRWPGRKHDWVGHTDYPWVRKFGLDPYRLSLGGDPAGSFRLLVKGLLLMLHERGGQRVDQYGAQLARDAPDLEGVITTNYDSLPEDVLRDERAINYGFTKMRSVFSAALAIREISNYAGDEVTRSLTKAVIKARPRAEGSFPVLKIHGSANHSVCTRCGSVMHWPHAENAAYCAVRNIRDCAALAVNESVTWHDCGPRPETSDVNHPTMVSTVVPPLHNKESLEAWSVLGEVQQRAIEIASTADRLLVVGSSVRASDRQLHQVLAATRGHVDFVGERAAFMRAVEVAAQASGIEHLRGRFFP